jgi:hypothetical protein
LSELLGGAGRKQRYETPNLRRELDRVVGDVGYESKAGVRQRPTTEVRKQIEADKWLLQNKKLRRIEWHFWRGASPSLQRELEAAGITPVIHPLSEPLIPR